MGPACAGNQQPCPPFLGQADLQRFQPFQHFLHPCQAAAADLFQRAAQRGIFTVGPIAQHMGVALAGAQFQRREKAHPFPAGQQAGGNGALHGLDPLQRIVIAQGELSDAAADGTRRQLLRAEKSVGAAAVYVQIHGISDRLAHSRF